MILYCVHHAFEYLFKGLGGVDDRVVGGIVFRLIEKSVAYAAVEIGSFGFHSIEERIEAGGGGLFIDIEDEDEVGGPGFSAGDLTDSEDVSGRKTPRGSLIGEGGTEESVGEDESATVEGGNDPFADDLCSARHEEEHFGVNVHLVGGMVLGIEENIADLFADRGSAWLPNFADFEMGMVFRNVLPEAGVLGRFSGAVRPVEDEETAGQCG